MITPTEMKMEAANNYADREVNEMLETLEDEILEADFRAHAEVMKVRSDRFANMRADD
jgi:hypothetical protein